MIEIVNIKITELKSAEYNPRSWPKKETEDLIESIKRFGLVDPIIVNSAPNRFNIIIGGHFRVEAAKQIGHTEVPVVYVAIPDINKEQELNIRLNKNLGRWDYELLANISEDILKDAGFGDEELKNIFDADLPDSDQQDPESNNNFVVVLSVPPDKWPGLRDKIKPIVDEYGITMDVSQ